MIDDNDGRGGRRSGADRPTADAGSGRIRPGPRRLVVAVVVGLLLVAAGTVLATWTATDGGEVDVYDATFETESGHELTATVYEPADASAAEPAPGVTLIHGYTGERGSLSTLGTELAARGYVAVSVDQPGHGDSEPPAFADGFGGPATLQFARDLETVDEDRVAMVGHSMGGFASLAAAESHPDDYASIVLIGSAPGPMEGVEGVPEANETWPRNLAVLFAPYDEYAPAMWGESVPGNVPEGEKLAGIFGTEAPVEAGTVYGSVENGTARTFGAPPTIHTGMHLSTTTVEETIEWVALTTGGPTEPAPAEQRWYWATVGHAIALLGGAVVAVGTTALVWRRLAGDSGGSAAGRTESAEDRAGSAEDRASPGAKATSAAADGAGSVASRDRRAGLPRSTLVGLSALPALAIYPLYAIGTAAVPVTRLTHQELTHGYVLWALGAVALAAVLVRWRHGGADRASLAALAPNERFGARSLATAAVGVFSLYLLVVAAQAVPGGDLGLWVVGFETPSGVRWVSIAVYAVPISTAAVGLAAGLDRALDTRSSLLRAVGRGLAITCAGLLVFLAVQYVPLFLGYGLPVPALGPLAIITISATGLLAFATVVAVAANRLTDAPLASGLLVGLLATWMIAGTGPVHVVPF